MQDCRKRGMKVEYFETYPEQLADSLRHTYARGKIPIFTTDADFTLFQHHLPIALHLPRF